MFATHWTVSYKQEFTHIPGYHNTKERRKSLFYHCTTTKKLIWHPLKKKDGLDELFEKCKAEKKSVSVEKLFAGLEGEKLVRVSHDKFENVRALTSYYGESLKITLEFPLIAGSAVYDGTNHECEVWDSVNFMNTSIDQIHMAVDIIEYVDRNMNARRRGLVFWWHEECTANYVYKFVPLIDSKGVNREFEIKKGFYGRSGYGRSRNFIENERDARKGDRSSGDFWFSHVGQVLSATKCYKNIHELESQFCSRDFLIENSVPIRFKAIGSASVPQKGIFDDFIATAVDYANEQATAPKKEVKTGYYKGHLWKDDGNGPFGLPSSSYWYSDDK